MVWMKKLTGKSPGYHRYTNEDIKRVSWCMDNGIKIATIPSGTKWQVELSINKNIHLDSNIYEADEAYKKMYEYYKYYYDKHNKQ
jgi:ABC-type branched-subunit amino acid transport system ATPase component